MEWDKKGMHTVWLTPLISSSEVGSVTWGDGSLCRGLFGRVRSLGERLGFWVAVIILFLDLGASYVSLVTLLKCIVLYAFFVYFLAWTSIKIFKKCNKMQTPTLFFIFLLWWEANPADIAVFTLVSKLWTFEETGPGGIHHSQDWLTALFCRLTEGSTRQESMTRRKEKGGN